MTASTLNILRYLFSTSFGNNNVHKPFSGLTIFSKNYFSIRLPFLLQFVHQFRKCLTWVKKLSFLSKKAISKLQMQTITRQDLDDSKRN